MANKFAQITAAVLALCALPPTANATMELYFSDFTGDPYQVQILPGESFEIQVGYATTEVSNGLSYWLNISDAGSGEFSITDREFPADGRFLDLITSNTQVLAPDAALLDPRNDRDLGALNNDPNAPEPPGLYVLATLTLAVDSDIVPGTYTLNGWQTYGSNTTGDAIPITVNNYTIVVTDGSGGGDTDGGSGDTTDQGTTDTDTGDQTTDGTDSGTGTGSDGTQADATDAEASPVAVTSRCGAGFGGITAMTALLALQLIRTPGRRA